MTDIEKYEAVNKTSTLKELAYVIRSFGKDGQIEGRSQFFDAEHMASACENYSYSIHNSLTRMYGIRQQAFMLLFYRR